MSLYYVLGEKQLPILNTQIISNTSNTLIGFVKFIKQTH